MKTVRFLTLLIDAGSERLGWAVSWLTLLMVLLTFTVVMLRYLFNMGWIAMQESITYLHATLFMLGAAYTLKADAHVRVDVFYRPMTARGKAWIDLFGALFLLLPVCFFLIIVSWPYVADSWALQEGSHEAGGIDLVWLLKSIIVLMPILVAVQGLAQIGHALLTLFDHQAS